MDESFKKWVIASLFFTGVANALTLIGIGTGRIQEANALLSFLNASPELVGFITILHIFVLIGVYALYHHLDNHYWRFSITLFVVASTGYNFADALNNILVLFAVIL